MRSPRPDLVANKGRTTSWFEMEDNPQSESLGGNFLNHARASGHQVRCGDQYSSCEMEEKYLN